MDRVPPTGKTEIEKVEEDLEDEVRKWHDLGMHPNMTQHTNESMWIAKMQIQTIFDIIIKKGLISEEETNLTYKRLMLIDMRKMREQAEAQRREALIPDTPILGPDGQPFKI